MVQTIPATKTTLYDLEKQFHLTQDTTESFFEEWQREFPPLTQSEQQRLSRIQTAVDNLERRSLLENTAKLAVLAPLLDLSGLFFPPFYVSTEDTVSIEATDDNLAIQGRIDILVMKEMLWLLVIESKRAEFSPKVGIPQALAYMLAAPQPSAPVYGLVTNGTDFIFLKLAFGDSPSKRLRQRPTYARSKQFVLGQDRDLEKVLQVLKHLAEVAKAVS